MKSMTGFGRSLAKSQKFSLTLDLSSVNKKGFETSVSLPRDWQTMERAISQDLKKYFSRGKISAALKVEFNGDAGSFSIDADGVAAALKKLGEVCRKCGAEFKPNADTVIALNEKVNASSALPDWEEALPVVEAALEEAAKKLDAMREEEGKALKADLTMRLQAVFELLSAVEGASKDTTAKYKEQLLQRLAASGLELDPDDERVLKEICLFADKCDICEEITRLKSHISQFLSTMEEADAVGRKMDFLCQEMGREINTIGSKANNLELTKIVIDMKNELERIREQVQNIE